MIELLNKRVPYDTNSVGLPNTEMIVDKVNELLDEHNALVDALLRFGILSRAEKESVKPQMTLEEAIQHAKEVADEKGDCDECGREHQQLAEWLTELKELRTLCGVSSGEWWSCSDHGCSFETYQSCCGCSERLEWEKTHKNKN